MADSSNAALAIPQVGPATPPPSDFATTEEVSIELLPALDFEIEIDEDFASFEAPTIANGRRPPLDFVTETGLEAETLELPRVKVGTSPGGTYEVRHAISEGPYGAVFVCWDAQRQQKVIVKMRRLRGLQRHRRDAVETRLLREADIGRDVQHPSIAKTLDVWRAGETKVVLVRELAEGDSLSTYLGRNGPMPPHQALRAFEAITGGLCALHTAGVVHRDLHPDHVIVGPEQQITLIGFGAARAPGSAMTSPGALIGTPGYMSPEVACGKVATPASDQFSAGTLLFEMLTGWRPFADAEMYRAMRRVLEEETPSLRSCGVVVPPSVERLVNRLHEKSPANRFRDEREWLDHVRRARTHVS